MAEKSRQTVKYLENEKGFLGEIKSIFHNFQRAFIERSKTIFLEGESPTLSIIKIPDHDLSFANYKMRSC